MAGRFFTDPSTLNNDPTHYDPNVSKPSPWQTPMGQHRFQFKDCSVRSVVGPQGPVSSDPLIGAEVATTDDPAPARIVDLDVYQQGVPTLFGLQLRLSLPDGKALVGTLDPATLNQLWWLSVLPTRSWDPDDYGKDSYGGDMNAAGNFQSVLRVPTANWPASSSAVLQQLQNATLQEDGAYLLSFKFTLDGYQNVPQNAHFLEGRIVGTLGPVKANEPRYNPGQRWMQGRPFSTEDPWYFPSFNSCPFRVDKNRKKLVIDLANGICRQSAGGPPVDLGTVNAVIGDVGMSIAMLEVGVVDYSAFAYENNAHIAELDLTDVMIGALDQAALMLIMSRDNLGPQRIFVEDIKQLNYCVETRPIRMEGQPGSTATTRVYVNRMGNALAGKTMAVFTEPVYGTTPGATVPPTNPGDTAQAKDALQASISATDAQGWATVSLQVVKDPGQRTPELDGQLYFVIVYDPEQSHPDWSKVAPAQEHLVSVVVFSHYPIQTNPAWETVKGLMSPYNKLYPSMRAQLDLTDPHSFTVFAKNPPWGPAYNRPPGPLGIQAGAIPYFMTLDFNDPRFMPITRDLSQGKLMTVLHFVKNLQEGNITPTDAQTITNPKTA